MDSLLWSHLGSLLFNIPAWNSHSQNRRLEINADLLCWFCFNAVLGCSYYCCSVSQLCLTFCNPTDCSMPGFLVLHHFLELDQIHVHWVGDTTQPSHPVIPFTSRLQSFPASRVFSSESVLHIRLPKYWSFSFSISPSNEYLGLISFRIDWFDLHAV